MAVVEVASFDLYCDPLQERRDTGELVVDPQRAAEQVFMPIIGVVTGKTGADGPR